MQRIKNILYDKNDILVALIIVCVAALIIFNRIDAIMAYPSTLSHDDGTRANTPITTEDTSVDPDIDASDAASTKTDENTDSKDNNSDQSDEGVVNHSVYIEYGSTASDIADILIKIKLVENRQQFYDALAVAGAESKLQAGTFTVPSDSTPAEVVAIITK